MLVSTRAAKKAETIAAESIMRLGLKKTSLRCSLLGLLMRSKGSLSQADIIDKMSKNAEIDRVSVYRNLAKLTAVGLVHRLEDNSYVACSHACTEHAHILLFCECCENHQELAQFDRKNPLIKALAQHFALNEKHPVFVKGTCKECRLPTC